MPLPFPLKPVTIVCGHYGVGKTNFALNLAIGTAEAGFDVTLIDLDIVNPYFRSSEYRETLEAAGVTLVAPVFAQAGTSLDVPSLTGAIAPAINRAYFDARKGEGVTKVIIDVGGDDAGATALSRFARDIASGPYDFLYVVNRFRNLTQTTHEAIEVLREIEGRCSLSATGIVGNSHLKAETSCETIALGLAFAREVSALSGLPLACVTHPVTLHPSFDADEKGYPVKILVKSPWE